MSKVKIKYKNILGKEFLTNYVDGRSISHIFVDNKDVYQLIVEVSDDEDFEPPLPQAANTESVATAKPAVASFFHLFIRKSPQSMNFLSTL